MKIVVAKVIGNDFGRHGQTTSLDHWKQSTALEDWKDVPAKISSLAVLNKLINPQHVVAAYEAVSQADARLDVDFRQDEYAQAVDKEMYVTDVNAARNRAIEAAFDWMGADYVLVLDARCVLTKENAEQLVANLSTQPEFAYYMCPQAVRPAQTRPLNTLDYWWAGWSEDRRMEVSEVRPYYVVFGKSAMGGPLYHEAVRYGEGTQTELLATLNVTGPWQARHASVRPLPEYLKYGRGTNIEVLPSPQAVTDEHFGRRAESQQTVLGNIREWIDNR